MTFSRIENHHCRRNLDCVKLSPVSLEALEPALSIEMGKQLSEERRASLYAKLLDPTLKARDIALAEGISLWYAGKLRVKMEAGQLLWPKNKRPQNSTKLLPYAFEVGTWG
jgi:hypothetical protein